ncbi:hypothetical protein HQ571_03115 [Candidatus Kuenenbacteria bacterium]|nr:hypothetical protein [Candidatus Kuenenbacteria bacterium]
MPKKEKQERSSDGVGTRKNPFWQPDISSEARAKRGFKYCRCSRCNKVALCVPDSDFLVTFDEKIRKLVLLCETCFDSETADAEELAEVAKVPSTDVLIN